MLATTVFIFYLILPLLIWFFRRRFTDHGIHPLVLFIATIVTGYLLYVGGVWLAGKEYESDLYAYDLDGDREFSEAETTPEAKEAMRRFTQDTGRSLTPMVAGPATFIWISVNFAIFGLISWIIVKFSPKHSHP
jgi:hypothetical protein